MLKFKFDSSFLNIGFLKFSLLLLRHVKFFFSLNFKKHLKKKRILHGFNSNFLNYAYFCRKLFSTISFFNFFKFKPFNSYLQDFKDFSFIFENLNSSFSKIFLVRDFFKNDFLTFKNGLFFFLKIFFNRRLFKKSIF